MQFDPSRAGEPGLPGAGALLRLRTQELEWRPFPEAQGVDFKLLRRHPEAGGSTLLLRFAPGAGYPAHRHPAGEEYYILSGSLEDGGSTYRAGDYIYYPPGSAHRPGSREGCTLLVVLPARVEPLGPHEPQSPLEPPEPSLDR